MFPEYRELMSQLKGSDRRFTTLFERHNELDQKIRNIEAHIEHAAPAAVEDLKKEKLLLKDQLHEILKKAAVAQ